MRHLPTLSFLSWLSDGQIQSRFERSLRCWYLIEQLYGETPLVSDPFSYTDLRSRLFAPGHPASETLPRQALLAACTDRDCLCKHTIATLLQDTELDLAAWATELGRDIAEHQPFARPHRSIRADLDYLVAQQWLTKNGSIYRRLAAYPRFPATGLSPTAALDLWDILDSLQQLKPSAATLLDDLEASLGSLANTRRTRIHIEYIVSPRHQDQVDDIHYQLTEHWQQTPRPIKLRYSSFRHQRTQAFITYPVCLQYARRAQYLSAYGQTPFGHGIGWYNFRLDRMLHLESLAWSDAAIPADLQHLHQHHRLPTPADIDRAHEAAWGFDFYLPISQLILRFPRAYAERYVHGSFRHATFRPIATQAITVPLEATSEPDCCYFQAQIRAATPAANATYQERVNCIDTNLLLRLRDWRPKGEVIAPLWLRQLMIEEARQELQRYNQR